MNTLGIVTILFLLCAGWAIGLVLVTDRYERLILCRIGRWRSHASVLRANAKELERERRIADAEKKGFEADVLTRCANELFSILEKEPRRII